MATKCVTSLPVVHHQPQRRSTFGYVTQKKSSIDFPRTSNLHSPFMRLEDHQDEVTTCGFHPFGELLVSSGRDKKIHVSRVYEEIGDVMVMSGHTDRIMEAQFSRDGLNVYSCSADKTLAIWDTYTGRRVNHLEGHSAEVNSVQFTRMGSDYICSGSTDRSVRIWDVRDSVHALKLLTDYKITSVCFNQTGEQVLFAGLDHDINIWDFRKNEVVVKVPCHQAAITGISLSPCGTHLLTHSIDESLRICDIRPGMLGEVYLEIFNLNENMFDGNLLRCAWSPDCKKISAGTIGRHAYIWDSITGKNLNVLGGHQSSINSVAFHPTEPIFMSGSSDGCIFLSETQE